MRTRVVLCLLLAVLTSGMLSLPANAARNHSGTRALSTPAGEIAMEFVGQVINTAPGVTPIASMQFGYLTYLRGVDTVFRASPQNETTALYTFFTDALTTRVINDGPLRIVDRTGTETIYQNNTSNLDFSNPNTFKAGTPIQVSTLRQQVIIDTVSGIFTCVNQSTVTSVSTFTSDGNKYAFGHVGDRTRSFHQGRLAAQGPPTGYVAGFIIGVGKGTTHHKHRSKARRTR
ncbi:MAG: hypothetical protein NVSMB52_07520 [Chloroflexota bacterium]